MISESRSAAISIPRVARLSRKVSQPDHILANPLPGESPISSQHFGFAMMVAIVAIPQPLARGPLSMRVNRASELLGRRGPSISSRVARSASAIVAPLRAPRSAPC